MPRTKSRKKQKTAKKAKESITLPIRNMSMMIMGESASGSKDKKTKHGVFQSDGSLMMGFDGTLKPKGKQLLESLQEDYGTVDEWIEVNGVKGSKKLAKDLKKDMVITQLVPENFVPEQEWEGETFDLEEDVLVKLVKLQTDEGDVLMPLFYENGASCSTGGYSRRAEALLANNIPFFHHLLSELHEMFDIKSLWLRSSENGTHGTHSDNFRKGCTHRGILSINCHEKMMSFER